jgi:hypothetical protein
VKSRFSDLAPRKCGTAARWRNEVALEIPTIQFADVGFAVASDEAAQPRERDESWLASSTSSLPS